LGSTICRFASVLKPSRAGGAPPQRRWWLSGAYRIERMGMNEDFWGDLLAHIRHQVLVPVVGPHVTTAKTGNTEQKLTTLIGQHLAEWYDLAVSPGTTTMDEAVAAFIHKRGREGVNRLYSRIDDIIVDLDAEPGDALRD